MHYSARPQIQIKSFQYTVTKYIKPKPTKPKPTKPKATPKPKPVKVTVKPKFNEMVKGGFKDNEVCMRAYLVSIG